MAEGPVLAKASVKPSVENHFPGVRNPRGVNLILMDPPNEHPYYIPIVLLSSNTKAEILIEVYLETNKPLIAL